MKNLFLKYGIFENKYLIGSFLLGLLMQIIVVIIPGLAKIFKLVPLNSIQWLYTLGISVLPLIIIQFQKRIKEIKLEKIIFFKYETNTK